MEKLSQFRIKTYVTYDPNGATTIGEAAKQKGLVCSENTIYDLSKLIGRKAWMDDPDLQRCINQWKFLVQEEEGTPKICINKRLYHPEHILATFLAELRSMAEKHLKLNPASITRTVISVPVNYNENQRQSIVNAGELAVGDVHILNEPSAAALAYPLEKRERKVLVFDLGQATFHLSLLNITSSVVKVLGVDADLHLGGQNFTQTLLDYCALKFREKEGIELMDGKDSTSWCERYDAERKLKRLITKCELAKRELSFRNITTVCLDALYNGLDLKVEVTREMFECLNQARFKRMVEILSKFLKEMGVQNEQIFRVILVGGSTRIPKVQEMLSQYFGEKILTNMIPPEVVIAQGAAKKGEMIESQIDCEVIDATPARLVGTSTPVRRVGTSMPTEAPTKDISVVPLRDLNSTMEKRQHGFSQRVQNEMTGFQKRLEESCRAVINGILEHYDNEMKTNLNASGFISENSMQSTHNRLQTEGLKEFEVFEAEGVAPSLTSKLRNEFQKALYERFIALKEENASKRKEIVTKLHVRYLESMKKELNCLYHKIAATVLRSCLEEFPMEMNETSGEQCQNELQSLMNSSFEELNAVLVSAKLSAEKEEREKGKRERKQKDRRAMEEARSVMEECFKTAVAQIGEKFKPSVQIWIEIHFNLNSITKIGTIYANVLKEITKEYENVIHYKLRREFVSRVDDHCKAECIAVLETITKHVAQITSGIKKYFDFHGYLSESKLQQVADNEFRKSTKGMPEGFIFDMIKLAIRKLFKIYEEHNKIIMEFEKCLYQKMMPQVVSVYNSQMKRYMVDAPYSPERLQRIHWKLSEKCVDAFKKACSLGNNQEEKTAEEAKALKEKLDSAFFSFKIANETKVTKMQKDVSKIIQNMKTQYNEKVEEILTKHPDGLNKWDLDKLHKDIQVELMKILEMEIKRKIRQDEPLENHKRVLQSHIDDYWPTIVAENVKNVESKKKRDEEEKKKREQEEAKRKLEEKSRSQAATSARSVLETCLDGNVCNGKSSEIRKSVEKQQHSGKQFVQSKSKKQM